MIRLQRAAFREPRKRNDSHWNTREAWEQACMKFRDSAQSGQGIEVIVYALRRGLNLKKGSRLSSLMTPRNRLGLSGK